MKESKNPIVNEYIRSVPEPLKSSFYAARETILKAGPDLTEDIKWKNCLTYILGKKNLIQTVVGKDKISLIFHNGAAIGDDSGLLKGDGNRTRTVRIESDDFDYKMLSAVVVKSIKLEHSK